MTDEVQLKNLKNLKKHWKNNETKYFLHNLKKSSRKNCFGVEIRANAKWHDFETKEQEYSFFIFLFIYLDT